MTSQEMKKSIFIFAMIMLVMASCNKMEQNEKKFVKGMTSQDYETATAAYDEFVHALLIERETMTHDFKLMKEKLGMKVITSPDGHLRCYSWVSGGNESVKMYSNVFQWINGNDFIGYNGPIDRLLAGRKADIKKESSLAHSVDTVFEVHLAEKTIYLIAQSYKNSKGLNRAYVSAAYIEGITLRLLPFFFDGVEIAGNNVFRNDDFKIGDLFKWDEKEHKFYAYQTDENDQLIPGKYTAYVLGEDKFTRLPEE